MTKVQVETRPEEPGGFAREDPGAPRDTEDLPKVPAQGPHGERGAEGTRVVLTFESPLQWNAGLRPRIIEAGPIEGQVS